MFRKIENMDEDDIVETEQNGEFEDFLEENIKQFDEEGDLMPRRGERRTAFNDELEIGELRLKG